MANRLSQYKVFPLPVVQKWARKKLSVVQLREGIKLARVAQILSRCARSTYRTMWRWNGTPHRASFNREDSWLRAIFWLDENAKTIYIVHLFWKKQNAISTADRLPDNQ